MKRLCCLIIVVGILVLPTPTKEKTLEKLPIVVVTPPKIKKVTTNELHVLHPAFRNKIILLLEACDSMGIKVMITETYRTGERQNYYYRTGRSRVQDGRSKHQYGLAIDLVPIINGKPNFRAYKTLKKIGIVGERLGLTWGGKWSRFYDPYHFEWDCTSDDLLNGELPSVPDMVLIPYRWREGDFI